jgi:hypothetical protein
MHQSVQAFTPVKHPPVQFGAASATTLNETRHAIDTAAGEKSRNRLKNCIIALPPSFLPTLERGARFQVTDTEP